jgi:hypothetical protein
VFETSPRVGLLENCRAAVLLESLKQPELTPAFFFLPSGKPIFSAFYESPAQARLVALWADITARDDVEHESARKFPTGPNVLQWVRDLTAESFRRKVTKTSQ